MSTNRGIFENFPNPPGTRQDLPFAVAREDSPFTVADESRDARPGEPAKPANPPEPWKQDSPFQVTEPTEGFGFEATPLAFAASPFEVAPPPAPFSTPAQPVPSPFSIAAEQAPRGPSAPTQAAIAAFSSWHESHAAPAPAAAGAPGFFEPSTAPSFPPVTHVPSAFSAAPAPAPAPAASAEGSQSDSFAIRQLELRAIFSVDREMTPEEILQRSRALPGVRNVARVAPQDMAAVEALKSLLPNLGFGSGSLKLYAGSVPVEFIREGAVLLAVQTDGGFAPGVRETLMIVARELGRLS